MGEGWLAQRPRWRLMPRAQRRREPSAQPRLTWAVTKEVAPSGRVEGVEEAAGALAAWAVQEVEVEVELGEPLPPASRRLPR